MNKINGKIQGFSNWSLIDKTNEHEVFGIDNIRVEDEYISFGLFDIIHIEIKIINCYIDLKNLLNKNYSIIRTYEVTNYETGNEEIIQEVYDNMMFTKGNQHISQNGSNYVLKFVSLK